MCLYCISIAFGVVCNVLCVISFFVSLSVLVCLSVSVAHHGSSLDSSRRAIPSMGQSLHDGDRRLLIGESSG